MLLETRVIFDEVAYRRSCACFPPRHSIRPCGQTRAVQKRGRIAIYSDLVHIDYRSAGDPTPVQIDRVIDTGC
jgi:hypothetical protein